MALVVPEGFLFRKDTSAVRHRIIKKNIGFMRLRISALRLDNKKRKIVGINDLNRRGWKIKFI
ncbi:hypothetical protein [Rickettsia rickettsii]|uniref:hypothetical protein n=1 Tax=Rickettsia rickettsii TaxID=783 RepID=UPI00024FA366|nr:hypothetical protein [Rickettsia rickettsii]AFB29608.1 hypothetical protein RPK_07395 [Rickettsia rickettsii str. Hlp\